MSELPGFERLIDAPKDILGKRLLLLHWVGATEVETLETVEHAITALQRGWTRYKVLPAEDGTSTLPDRGE